MQVWKQIIRSALALIVATLLLLGFAAGAPPVPSVAVRQEAISAIQAVARRHVEIGKPADTSDVWLRFEDDPAALSRREIADIYELEYGRFLAQRTADERSPARLIEHYGGWLAALVIVLILVSRKALEGLIAQVVEWMWKPFYRWLRSRRALRRLALRDYRQALLKKYSHIPLTFRPNKKLDLSRVYVPLQATSATDQAPVDATNILTKFRRSVVVGAPGSGKSMLIKHLAFTWAQGGTVRPGFQSLPVVLELHELSASTRDIKAHLLEGLERNDFPNGSSFLDYALTSGSLTLLLDGLDEVPSASGKRDEVVAKIRHLIDTYEKCRVVITCRSAVYRDEFSDLVDGTAQVLEFSDQNMTEFLRNWDFDARPDRSVEQLLRTLADRPRIKSISRNPLMLTIVALLYEEPHFALPHSRAEFYQEATEVLLWQHHSARNQYGAPVKRRVLQHLALCALESQNQAEARDGRTLTFDQLSKQVRAMLPDLNLDPEQHAQAIVREIIERSGLLLELDGGEHFQFAHLTLQEFFAAERLRDDLERLYRSFQADPDAWREPVKLWCGIATDSTALIERIERDDALTAFECLAETKAIRPEVAGRIISRFGSELGKGPHRQRISRGLAALAADPRPRGASALAFLTASADSPNPETRSGALEALASSNLPSAAVFLAHRYETYGDVGELLVRMGDLAVSELDALAARGQASAVGLLGQIGTGTALAAIVRHLWSFHPAVAIAAARCVGTRLGQYAQCLQELHPPAEAEDRLRFPVLGWVWTPFAEEESSSVGLIVGRVAHLLNQKSATSSSLSSLDERIVFALCLVENRTSFDSTHLSYADLVMLDDAWPANSRFRAHYRDPRSQLRQVAIDAARLGDTDRCLLLVNSFLKALRAPDHCRTLVNALPPARQAILISRLTDKGASPLHWRNMFHPVEFEARKSWRCRLLTAALLGLLVLAASDWLLQWWRHSLTWRGAAYGLAEVSFAALWLFAPYLRGAPYLASGRDLLLPLYVGTAVSTTACALGAWLLGLVGIHGFSDLNIYWWCGIATVLGLAHIAVSRYGPDGHDRPYAHQVFRHVRGFASVSFAIIVWLAAGHSLVHAWVDVHRRFVDRMGGSVIPYSIWGLGLCAAIFVYSSSARQQRLSDNPCHGLFPAPQPAAPNSRRLVQGLVPLSYRQRRTAAAE
jgi:hypothetical protein